MNFISPQHDVIVVVLEIRNEISVTADIYSDSDDYSATIATRVLVVDAMVMLTRTKGRIDG